MSETLLSNTSNNVDAANMAPPVAVPTKKSASKRRKGRPPLKKKSSTKKNVSSTSINASSAVAATSSPPKKTTLMQAVSAAAELGKGIVSAIINAHSQSKKASDEAVEISTAQPSSSIQEMTMTTQNTKSR